MDPERFVAQSQPFLQHLAEWYAALPDLPLEQDLPAPENAAIVSIDVINGFAKEGALASPRIRGIVDPIAQLFERAWERGVRHILLIQEAHEPDAVEFGAYAPHGVRGTAEAEAVDEFKALPFYKQMTILPKNSISPAAGTGFDPWIAEHPEVDTFIAVGDCTDLCTYQLAMHLRTQANARQLQRRIIVPAEGVETYDLPVETARTIGAVPHDGDLHHLLFLHHMAQNGVEVVRRIV